MKKYHKNLIYKIITIFAFGSFMYGLSLTLSENIPDDTTLAEVISPLFSNPIYIIAPIIAVSVTGILKLMMISGGTKKDLLDLLGSSMVLAYYTQYGFLRTVIEHNGYVDEIDIHIDKKIDAYTNKSEKFVKSSRIRIDTFLEQQYKEYLENIQKSRLNLGLMLAKLRTTFNDREFRNDYRWYVIYARQTSYHIQKIMQDPRNSYDEFQKAKESLRKSDIVKIYLEYRISNYNVLLNILKKSIIRLLQLLPPYYKFPIDVYNTKGDSRHHVKLHELDELDKILCCEGEEIKDMDFCKCNEINKKYLLTKP